MTNNVAIFSGPQDDRIAARLAGSSLGAILAPVLILVALLGSLDVEGGGRGSWPVRCGSMRGDQPMITEPERSGWSRPSVSLRLSSAAAKSMN